jgi:hypothetical protein
MATDAITRADIEAKLAEIKGEVDPRAEQAKGALIAAAAAGAVVVILGVYLLGRRRGRSRQTVVEVKRV